MLLGMTLTLGAGLANAQPIDDMSQGPHTGERGGDRSVLVGTGAMPHPVSPRLKPPNSRIPIGRQLPSPAAANKQEGAADSSLCADPVLSQLLRHQIAPGETLGSIAQRYNLIPATLMGLNPILQDGSVPVGQEILVPPYNGIRVEAAPGSTWRELAEAYNVRPGVLFEVNGCQPTPGVVFVPGVNWSPQQTAADSVTDNQPLTGYPLPNPGTVVSGYGWQLDEILGDVVFRSGVTLMAQPNTAALAVGDGVVAFAGPQDPYGNLVVVNHSQGLQTRYAQLSGIQVQAGQTVTVGQALGQIAPGADGSSAFLYFEVRSNSNLGWIAQDPATYIDGLRLR